MQTEGSTPLSRGESEIKEEEMEDAVKVEEEDDADDLDNLFEKMETVG